MNKAWVEPPAIATAPEMPRWRKALNRVGAVVLGLLAVVLVLLLATVGYRLWAAPMYVLPNIAHAGGALGDVTYVNGVDAFDSSYAKGFRTFEVDFEITSDGTIVCGHDWNSFGGKPVDMTTFLAGRAKMKYEVCLFDQLTAWFKAHADAQLVADSKADVLTIDTALRKALGPQLIPEAYTVADALALSDNARYPVLLALYKLDDGIQQRYAAVAAMRDTRINLLGVAMSMPDAAFGLALWAKLWTGKPVTVYTANSCSVAPTLHALAVDQLMTDSLTPTACR